MELNKAIKLRRSVRHYNKKFLNKNTIKKIISSGLLAPSAKNREPWSFIVIKNKDLKEKISNLLNEKTESDVNLTCNVIKECQALILVYGNIENNFDTLSIGACIENMLLTARDLNVASLWIGYILKIEKELSDMFKSDKCLISAVALGYTDKFPRKRPRKTLNECTIWY